MGPSSSRKPTSAVLASEDVHKVCTGKRSTVSKVVKPSYRCGDGSHVPSKCPFLKATCLGCRKVERACFKTTKSKKKSKGSQHTVSHVDEQSGDTTDYPLFVVRSRSKVPPIEITVRIINDSPLTMEVDTGASLTHI